MFFLLFLAWCLRSEGVSSVLLGVSTTDQLLENLGALRVIIISNLVSHTNKLLLGLIRESFKADDFHFLASCRF